MLQHLSTPWHGVGPFKLLCSGSYMLSLAPSAPSTPRVTVQRATYQPPIGQGNCANLLTYCPSPCLALQASAALPATSQATQTSSTVATSAPLTRWVGCFLMKQPQALEWTPENAPLFFRDSDLVLCFLLGFHASHFLGHPASKVTQQRKAPGHSGRVFQHCACPPTCLF
jgi:hypothetical protein